LCRVQFSIKSILESTKNLFFKGEDLSMDRELLNSKGDFPIVASENSSLNDFDFFVGEWKVHNKKLKTRLSGCAEWTEFEATSECKKILNGFGNSDLFQTKFDSVPFEGMTL